MKLLKNLLLLNLFILTGPLLSQSTTNKLFNNNSPDWVRTNGPGGGAISDLVIDPDNPDRIYAVGIRDGIYRTSDGGQSWQLRPFAVPGICTRILLSPDGVLYANHQQLSKSGDGGETWTYIWQDMEGTADATSFALDPDNSHTIYVGGGLVFGEGAVYKSGNGGVSWTKISGNLSTPDNVKFERIAVPGDGKILMAGTDPTMTDWQQSRLFFSGDDGTTWDEIDYGSIEDRLVLSLEVNPYDRSEVWLTEEPLYGVGYDQPMMFKSADSGKTWTPVTYTIGAMFDGTKLRIMGFDNTGRVYIGGGGYLAYTDDGGASFQSEDNFGSLLRFDLKHIYPHPSNQSILYLPTNAGGIIYSDDRGASWTTKNNGINATGINLVTADPQDPGVVYAGSYRGDGLFKTEDYGQTWINIIDENITHPFGDEITVDPSDPDRVWFVGDVPFIYFSDNGGDSWVLKQNANAGGQLNFSSVYAMDITEDDATIFALNNGFGIFKSGHDGEGNLTWKFLTHTEVDYSYSIDIDPRNSDKVFSGYSRKPFQTAAKVMSTSDGGDHWQEVLSVDKATAVTSVMVDPGNSSAVYAASVGESGGAIWKSSSGGAAGTWSRTNAYFNFTTIHSFDTDSTTAIAGVWGGGTYKTSDGGSTWEKLGAPEVTSAAALEIVDGNPNIMYAADRTRPVLYRSNDGGRHWEIFFQLSDEYRRLMCVVTDPGDPDLVYTTAMKRSGPGKEGGIFKIDHGSVQEITNGIERVPLTLTIDPSDTDVLYAVLHESGVFRSSDGGMSWTNISAPRSGLPQSGFNGLVIDPNDSQILYIFGGCDVRFATFASAGIDPDSVATVYRSDNGGQTWENLNRGEFGADVGNIKNLCFHQHNSDHLYIATQKGVYYSLDRGVSWQKSGGLAYETLGGIAIEGNTLFAYTNGAGLFTGTIQTDGSILWEADQHVVAPIAFAQVLVHPTDGDIVYASGYPGGIFRSDDGGASWHEKNFGMVSFSVDDPLHQGYYALAISKSNPDILYLGLYRHGIYRSFNGGDTWYPVQGAGREMADQSITSLAIDPLNADHVFVGTEHGIFETGNGGVTWACISVGISPMDVKALKLNSAGTLFAGTKGYGMYQWDGTAWKTLPPFGGWGSVWPMWDNRPLYQYTSTLIHPSDNNKMLIGTFPQGIYKSEDGGETWRESNVGWTFDGVFELVCHPLNPEIVYAGTYNGINRSTNFGETWEMWDNGWPEEQWVFSIDFDPTNPDIMYACSKNGENEGTGREGFHGTVMKSTNGGETWFSVTQGLDLDQEFLRIIVDRFSPSTVYLAAEKNCMMRSTNGGATWQDWSEGMSGQAPGTNGNNVTKLLALSADHSILYYGSSGQGVYRRMISPTLPVNNLGAQIVNHHVVLSWQFDDLNNNFGSYSIYRSGSPFTDLIGLSAIASISSVSNQTYTDETISPGVPYYYAVTTSDNSGNENDHVFVLGPVVDAGLSITTAQLSEGHTGEAYCDTLQASGGVAPYIWSLTEGTLPPDLLLHSKTGIIAGTLVSAGEYTFTLKVADSQVTPDTATSVLSITVQGATDVTESTLPDEYRLYQNYPNPFNPRTEIKFEVPERSHVKLIIFDLMGRTQNVLIDDEMSPGRQAFQYNASESASGIYFCLIQMKSAVSKKQYQKIRKIVLVK